MQIVTSPSFDLVARFLRNAGESLRTFRYFDKRPLQSIDQHLVTMIFLEEEIPFGYGHLDMENGNVWLGIAIADEFQGMGFGNLIMTELINYANTCGVENINLSVDKDNQSAISLYTKFDFAVVKEINERSLLMVRNSTMVKDLYVSTLAFSGLTVEEIIESALENNFALEFSSSLPYRSDMEELYKNNQVKRVPHNYFPAPSTPFVLNLASSNNDIRSASIAHCKKGLLLSEISQSPFFSAHAGFCIDPNPDELGRKIEVSINYNRKLNMNLFIESLNEILQFQSGKQQMFLIENNVIAEFNMTPYGNPLLCCESRELIEVFDKLDSANVGLLLDTAHLKVSCNTLGLDIQKEVTALKPYIKCIHHSDNDGKKDTNDKLKNDYWFLEYMNDFKNVPHVLEVKNLTSTEIKEQIRLIKNYGCD